MANAKVGVKETQLCPACGQEFSCEEKLTACPSDGSRLILLKGDPLLGTTIAERYEIQSRLGVGGWSTVYKANDLTCERNVAIKVLHDYLLSESDRVKRFQREAQAASNLKHDAISAVHDFGLLPKGQPFIVMEYIEGIPLSELIKEQGHLEMRSILPIFVHTCDALEFAHQSGVLHRDLKPSNILVVNSPQGERAKIVDFGLAKFLIGQNVEELTASGETLGTPQYMSPEQCRGQKLDGRSDIYSLGCVLFESLTGRKPVSGKSTFECMTRHLIELPPTLAEACPAVAFPKTIELVVKKALSKDAADRYQTMDDFKLALLGCLVDEEPKQAESTHKNCPDLLQILRDASKSLFKPKR